MQIAPPVQEVVVTAPRPVVAGLPAFSAVAVRADRLDDDDGLDAALQTVPGVQLFRRGSSASANPTVQGLSLRSFAGSGAGRALVTLDGVPVNDPFGGWVIWTGLPSEGVSSATVLRGAGAGPFGAGALTGVVELTSLRPGQAAATLATEEGRDGYFGAGWAERGALAVASVRSDNGFEPVRGAEAGEADRETSLRSYSLGLRQVFAVGVGADEVAARFDTHAERRSTGVEGGYARASGSLASLAWRRAAASGGLEPRAQVWAHWSDLASTSVSVAAGRDRATPANDQYATPALGLGASASVGRRQGALDWAIGADVRWARGVAKERFRYLGGAFTRDRASGGESVVGGVYAEATWRSGAWLATGGARLDGWRDIEGRRRERDLATGATTLDLRDPDRGGSEPTFRLGVRRALGEAGFYARAAAYAGFRPATLNELHRPFRVGNDVTEANAALKPERLIGTDAALGWARGASHAELGAFLNRLDDPVVNVTLGQGPGVFPAVGFLPAGGTYRQRRNAGRIDAAGLEAEAERWWSGVLHLRAAVNWTVARVDGGSVAPQLTGRRPAQAPRITATGGAEWQALPRLRLEAELRYEGDRFDDDQNTRRLKSASVLGLQANWRLKGPLEAWISLANVTDARVQTAVAGDGTVSLDAPRQLSLGLRWRGR